MAVIVHNTAPDIVRSRTSNHARWRLVFVKVFRVGFTIGCGCIGSQHLLQLVHCHTIYVRGPATADRQTLTFDTSSLYDLDIPHTRNDSVVHFECDADTMGSTSMT
jgi:hypothetical protein